MKVDKKLRLIHSMNMLTANQNIFVSISLHLFIPLDKLYFILMFK